MYNVKIPKFEGPLNLLLALIEEQKLDISEVSIANVSDDYLEYIRSEDNISLENLAEFVNIASKIILIKSRNILPTIEVTPEEEKEIKDLEEQLRLYKKYKEAAKKIGGIFGKRPKMYSREFFLGLSAVFIPPKNVNAYELKKYFLNLVNQIILPEKMPEEAVRGIVTLEQKINELQKNLRDKIEMSFANIKDSAVDKVEVIVSFLALLELMKQKIVQVEQRGLFSDILIKNSSSK
jgi:segregation and condensation protein A